MTLEAATTPAGPIPEPLASFVGSTDLARFVSGRLGPLVDPAADPVTTLASHLADRSLMLVLDTCEHLPDAAAALVAPLLSGCPGLSVVTTTSREPLRVDGEAVWRVAPLADDDAVTLFVDRARLAAPEFDPDPRGRHEAAMEVAQLAWQNAEPRGDRVTASSPAASRSSFAW